jgi:hypothetical protein
MDGIYFQQGVEAAQGANSVNDCSKLRPYPDDSTKGRTWTNGFLWEIYRIESAYKKALAGTSCMLKG